mmetsp:Transcript_13271/g.28131  ORF Transcript_13271/g.28131 Transcript_13271/m.28131 type:complete len:436 (+) Transcript_13271:65-1372(+)|eukprot:CAMPEP_0171339718 /NCGR_PEP_ID=MMETSP0878-20121228/8108_1 /TAXON_ID=67004 /ORGANISM="Thalassiosira weissflogii, Strain CCMP1336" /LENGTH=435 /DNA_ID=CAMNT_0011841663 /DNA_START=12 /DNA_END=1319 /DNA_ORIENTATION=-
MTAIDLLPSLLHHLSGTYRDPQRVIRDAENLLRSPLGRHLRPTTEPLILDDGTSTPPVLMLGGTLPMTYRGQTYNIPIDIYLPPAYPLRPPTVFVRPVSTMAIKENHRHVGLDGRVYLPYLSEWRPGTHELTELAVWMSSLFGSDPPCYAKRTTATSAASSVGSGSGGGNPPSYSQASTTSSQHSSYGASYGASNGTSATSAAAMNQQNNRQSESEEERRRRQAIEKEIAEANLAAEAARRAAEEEARIEAEQTRLRQEHEQTVSKMRVMAASKAEFKIQALFSQYREEMKVELKDQKLLERGKETIERLLKEGEEKKAMLEKDGKQVDGMIEELEEWLASVDASNESEEDKKSEEIDGNCAKVDLLALPADTHSAQMLELSAEIATIDDCIYYLDQSLVRGGITLDVFMKEVRKLSKRQFLAKAHLMKIARIKS